MFVSKYMANLGCIMHKLWPRMCWLHEYNVIDGVFPDNREENGNGNHVASSH